VRLGVTAPAEVAVHRREVYDLIRAENEQAALAAGEVAALATRLRGAADRGDAPAASEAV
jgi:sRNA-binding carbon storage regulator CsrA